MGIKNYLIEGVSGTGKTSVCTALENRGYDAIHGDRVLSYQGDPKTGVPLDGLEHAHHIWDVAKVRTLIADTSHAMTFFCGGSRNHDQFIHLFDAVFVLEVDIDTLHERLDGRPGEWGASPEERALIVQLHTTRQDLPQHAVLIDATRPLDLVVEDILSRCATGGS